MEGIMEVNSTLNATTATVPTDRTTAPPENQEPRRTETTETPAAENKEAYKVTLSADAQKASAAQTPPPSGPEGADSVQAYTNTGRLAG
jgi:hypothetical protein